MQVRLGGPVFWQQTFGSNQAAFVTLSALDPRSRQQLTRYGAPAAFLAAVTSGAITTNTQGVARGQE